MRVTVHLSDGATLDIEDFDADTALDLTEGLEDQRFLTFEMDAATVLVNRDHIVRLDIE